MKKASFLLGAMLFPWLVHAQAPANETFDIDRFVVEGNTLLPQDEVESIVAPFTGKQRVFGDIHKALDKLEHAYRQAGYSAVEVLVPEQELTAGHVTFKIIEPRLRSVQISGNRHFDDDNVRSAVPNLQEGSIPNAALLAGDLRLANEMGTRQIDVILKLAEEPGRIDAEVVVTDEDPGKFLVTLDNTGSAQTGEYRLGLGYKHDNLFNRDHSLTVQYLTAPEKPNSVKSYVLGYRLPLYRMGDSIDLVAAYSDTDAGTTITPAGPLAFSGKGRIAGARYNWNLPKSGSFENKASFGLDYRAFENVCSLGDYGPAGCGSAGKSVTTHPITVGIAGKRTLPGSHMDFTASFTKNFAGGKNGRQEDFGQARPSPVGGAGARADYGALRWGGSYLQAAGDWLVRGSVTAQYSPHALIPGEQLGLAGSNAVRGFSEREVARDRGFWGTLEATTPELAGSMGIGSLRAVFFYDFGSGANKTLEGELAQHVHIASVGAGLRYLLDKKLSVKLDVAHVLDDAATTTAKGKFFGHFGAALSF